MDVAAEAVFLAHQGGWDEILMVLAPLAIFGGLLMLANRRAERLGEGGDDALDSPDEHSVADE